MTWDRHPRLRPTIYCPGGRTTKSAEKHRTDQQAARRQSAEARAGTNARSNGAERTDA